MAVIMGIDPGLGITGFGIAHSLPNRIELRDYGYLKLPSQAPLAQRIHQFYDFFQLKIQQHQVTDLVIETPFLGRNAQVFLKLGYLRGVLQLLSAQHNLQLYEFPPRQIKLAVTGFGGASKEQVARAVLRLLPGLTVQSKLDVTDALAITLCGVWRTKSTISYAVSR